MLRLHMLGAGSGKKTPTTSCNGTNEDAVQLPTDFRDRRIIRERLAHATVADITQRRLVTFGGHLKKWSMAQPSNPLGPFLRDPNPDLDLFPEVEGLCTSCFGNETIWDSQLPLRGASKTRNRTNAPLFNERFNNGFAHLLANRFKLQYFASSFRTVATMACGGYGGGGFVRGLFRRENSGGGNFATLANPNAQTASRTHCTANASRFPPEKISPPS